jgi:hypothetical protein
MGPKAAHDRDLITGYTLPGNFGQATAARDPRQVQIGLKLIL